MKILCIGDPHFKVDNSEESQHFTLQIERWLKTNHVDAVVILGDILHSHEKVFILAMNNAVEFMHMCARYTKTYCLVGNHDATNNSFYCSNNHWMTSMTFKSNLTIIDRPYYMDLCEQVLLCPYAADGRFVESLDEFAPDWKHKAKLIFAHQMFDGAKYNSVVAKDVEVWERSYPIVISGHVHESQEVQPNLYYVGNSNEKSDRGIVIVEISNEGVVKRTPLCLALKEKKTVIVNTKEVATLKLQADLQYKIVIKDVEASIKAFKKTALAQQLYNMSNVKTVQYKLVAVKQDTTMTEDEVRNQDFSSMLLNRIDSEDDTHLSSYARSLLLGTEDISNKVVMFDT